MKRYGGWILPMVAGLAITCDAGHAQELAASEMGYARSVGGSRKAPGSGSWQWVHAGVALQVAGSFGDWATSWKQPEGNQLLAEPGGRYSGTFYRSGTVYKAGISAGLAAVSYGTWAETLQSPCPAKRWRRFVEFRSDVDGVPGMMLPRKNCDWRIRMVITHEVPPIHTSSVRAGLLQVRTCSSRAANRSVAKGHNRRRKPQSNVALSNVSSRK